ncbi:hypothetical protein [Flavobacterium caseinilyticum]|uniref:Uncharacterized protein n=1 Tax=Flavobacterium caseinilyticum TaxID=2541732 RepID=A0A4R5AY94_9FLAO|nr:hypothetical protein [Flavobacterium caseinilyticum]TDD77089.1 hypothetical protein E0F89_05685 [Flavobacterium caseinilyticum]
MSTTIKNEKLFCTNCGGEFTLKFPLQIPEMNSKIKLFADLHKDCEQTYVEPVADQSKDIETKALWWIANGHVGLSSKTMWLFFLHQDNPLINHPHDPDDFSRCYKLLEAVPEWKGRILELSKLSLPWKNLAENWEKLTAMYEQNKKEDWKNSEKIGMYEFMQTLTR